MSDKLFINNEVIEIERSPGFVERRRLLWLPIFTAALLFSRPRMLNAQTQKPDLTKELGWDEFLKQSIPTAQELHKDSSNHGQDIYLYTIASLAVRLRLKEIPRAKLQQFGSLNPPVHFGVSHRGVPFFFVEWWMEPGAILPAHNHPNASVCTLGLEGEARVRNFEIVGDAPEYSSKNTFQIRETRNELICTGRIITLSSSRDNIHTFQAGKQGARGIDISTYHGKDAGFSFIEIGEKPVDTERRIFEAVWKNL
jgi:hypothetical protein